MAYALQNLNSGLAGQKTIQPVRAPGETPAPATIGLGAPPARVYAPPAANPYAPTGTPPPPTAAPAAQGWNTLGSTPQWDAVNALPHLKDQFSGLGFTGDLYGYGASSNTGGESGMDFQGGGPQVSAGLQSWLDENKYSLQGKYAGSDLQMRIADANGATVGNSSHYESNDAGWFEKAVPLAIATMGAGAIGQGLGLWGSGAAAGNGAFLGEGVASGIPAWDAAAGIGAEMAALPASQIGAMTPTLESMLPSVADAAAWESALPGMTPGMTVGGSIVDAALPSLASVAAYESALPGMIPGTTVGGTAVAGLAGAGLTSQIGSALSSAAGFAKANPQLAALGLSGATSLLGGTPDAPAQPGSGGSGSGGTSNDALIQKLTEQLYGANGSMANAFDYSKIPGLQTSAGDPNAVNQQAIDAAYSKQTGMLDPQFQRDQQALEARLAEQGFVPGTPGYDRAMGVFGETRNKAYGSARDSSILQGYQIGQGQFGNQLSNAQLNNNASNSALAQALQQRNQPLNELNALKGGQQLAYENQLGQYNADVASSNSKNQALSQLALALGIYLG